MTLREPNSELHWASARPEDNTPATAVAVGHFVQVGFPQVMFASGMAALDIVVC